MPAAKISIIFFLKMNNAKIKVGHMAVDDFNKSDY